MTQLLKSSIAFIFLFLTYSLTGQSIFSPSVQITKPEVINPTKAIIFDIDNDQLNDILVVGSYPDNIVWFKNLGEYKFSEKIPIYSNDNLGAQTGGIVSDDVNGDGFIDFIAYEYELYPPGPFGGTSYVYRKCYWRENLQGNGFGAMIEINVDTTKLVSEFFDVADIDGDGLNDLVYGLVPTWTKKVANTEWGESFSIEVEAGAFLSSSLGDINNDGLIDFALTTFAEFDTANIFIYQNMGNGQFNLHSTQIFNEIIYQAIISDYNSDGIADLIAVTYDEVYFLKQTLAGSFEPPVLLHSITSTGNLNIYPVLVADIDGNGEKDLITQDKVLLNNEKLLLHFNGAIQATVKGKLGNSQGIQEDYIQVSYIVGDPFSIITLYEYNAVVESFLIHPIAGQGNGNLDNTIAIDFDNDGDKDIISGHCLYECISTNPLKFSDCNSFFHKILDYENDRFSDFLGVFDYNNDGFPEIVTGSRNATGIKKIKFYLNGLLDTTILHTLEFPENSFDIDRFEATYSKDLNSDGYEDLIVLVKGDGNTSRIITFFNTPQSGLTLNQEVDLPFRCKKLEFHDLDGNGKIEVLGSSYNNPLTLYYSELTEIGLLLPFEVYVEFEDNIGHNHVNFSLGRIDDDEILDIYYAYHSNLDEGYSLIGQLPLGSFISGPNLPGLVRPHILDDFDHDGYDELIYSEIIDTANPILPPYDGYTLFLLDNLSSSDPQFIDSITFYSYQNIFPRNYSIAVDFDNDLDKDILYMSGVTQILIIENNLNFPAKNSEAQFEKDGFVVYPNPTNNSVNIELIDDSILTDVVLFDSLGRVLKRVKLNNTSTRIELSNLQSGVYYLKANSTSIKLIKN